MTFPQFLIDRGVCTPQDVRLWEELVRTKTDKNILTNLSRTLAHAYPEQFEQWLAYRRLLGEI